MIYSIFLILFQIEIPVFIVQISSEVIWRDRRHSKVNNNFLTFHISFNKRETPAYASISG